MELGERFLLDVFEFESTVEGYLLWAADDAEPVASVVTRPERCQVCMLRSGLRFPCASLDEAERKIATCRALGL